MDRNIFEKIEIPGVKHIIIVASGKGGVGKSTVSANLSVSLARQGYQVALVDTDLYGPSIPMMFGVQNEKLQFTKIGDQQRILPIEKYGVKIVSIGFYIDRSKSLSWRGPLVSKAVTQLFGETVWENIDYMIVDFPPGTGDIHLTTVQKLNITGAVIVTTPQDVAIADARKAADMFTSVNINTPILGVVENMSWFTPREHPDEKYFIFGKEGGKKLAEELSVPLIGQIPFEMEIGEKADNGLNVYNQQDNMIGDIFDKIANNLITNTETR